MYFTRADYLQPTDREGNCQWTKGAKMSTPDTIRELTREEEDMLEYLTTLERPKRPQKIECKKGSPTPQMEVKEVRQRMLDQERQGLKAKVESSSSTPAIGDNHPTGYRKDKSTTGETTGETTVGGSKESGASRTKNSTPRQDRSRASQDHGCCRGYPCTRAEREDQDDQWSLPTAGSLMGEVVSRRTRMTRSIERLDRTKGTGSPKP